MTTGEISLVMGLFLILGLNAAVYALRLFFLSLQKRHPPLFSGCSLGFGPGCFLVSLDGLDQEKAQRNSSVCAVQSSSQWCLVSSSEWWVLSW